MRRNLIWAALLALSLSVTNANAETVTYDFNNDNPLDSQGVGAEFTVTSSSGVDVTLTTVDIIAFGAGNVLTSNLIDGANHTTNSTTADALGINSVGGGPPTNASNDPRDFDVGEVWTFSFDVDVELVSLDFAGQGDGEAAELRSSAFTTFTLNDGEAGDTHFFNEQFVAAGTSISLATISGGGVRATELIVQTVAVPEPSSLVILGLLGGVAAIRRRR